MSYHSPKHKKTRTHMILKVIVFATVLTFSITYRSDSHYGDVANGTISASILVAFEKFFGVGAES